MKTSAFVRKLGVACGLSLALGVGLVSAQDGASLTIVASGDELRWINESVIPACTAQLADAGMPVTVEARQHQR
jgi:hypothetical protein